MTNDELRMKSECLSRSENDVRGGCWNLSRFCEIDYMKVFVVLGILVAMFGEGAEFYISPSGADINPGTRSKPFGTLERARAAVRDLRRKQSASNQVDVILLGGDYSRTNGLAFTWEDSGQVGAPVVWRADEGERVRLLGGRVLRGFQPLTDRTVLARLPETARRQVLQLNLRSLGINSFGEMKSRGFARSAEPAHCELFYGGKPMVLARWPNVGQWEQIAGFPATDGRDDGHNGQIGKLEGGFYYAGERPGGWKDATNVWVHGYWDWDWANSYERIASLDLEKHLVRTAPPYGNYGFRKGQRFCFLNILE